MRKFIILTTPRSGSTLLWRYLDSHPGVEGHGEMFLPTLDRTDTFTAFRKASLSRKIIHAISLRHSVSSYLEQLFQGAGNVDGVCFKLMYHQIFPELEQWLKSNDVYVVHLVRENTLKMILSRRIAAQTNVYHQFIIDGEAKNSEGQTQVHLNPGELIAELDAASKQVSAYRDQFKDSPYYEINYEDFVADMSNETENLLGFLGIPAQGQLKVPLKKVNADSPEQLIENYQEVREALRSTVYEALL